MDARFTELSRIPVSVGPKRSDGRLAASWSDGQLVLRSSTPVGTVASVGVNVDSVVLLDALGDRTIFDVEVLVPRPIWQRRRAVPEPPLKVEQGTLVLMDPGPRIFVDALSPRLRLDPHSKLHIEIDPIGSETRWVSLSLICYALLNSAFLAGFVVDLASKV